MRNEVSLLHRDLTERVIGGFYDTYNELGPGFPEFVCRTALAITLTEAGLRAEEEMFLPVWFRARRIAKFKVDLVVAGVLLVEVKATARIEPWHVSQLRHYLKATELSVGLLVNFGPRPVFRRVIFETARVAHRNATGPMEVDVAADIRRPSDWALAEHRNDGVE